MFSRIGGVAPSMVRRFASGAKSFPKLSVLDGKQVQSALEKALPAPAKKTRACYSSIFGGIVTDPALMVVPLDDHMVHRGHAVFDTANIVNGKAYGLKFHLNRLLRSADMAKIPRDFTREELTDIILQTMAASGLRDMALCKYWLSVGRGDFGISPKQCGKATFHCVVHDYGAAAGPDPVEGLAEYTVSVPLKPQLLATMKSTNYLLNALTAMESEAKGGYLGLMLTQDGYVAEHSVACFGMIDKQRNLRTPPFDSILASTTLQRTLDLADTLVKKGVLAGVKVGNVHKKELAEADEMLTFGGGYIRPIISLDGKPVGKGKVGPVTTEIHKMLRNDMLNNNEYLDVIPYSQFGK